MGDDYLYLFHFQFCSLTLSLSRRERDVKPFALWEKGGESAARGPQTGAKLG